MVVPGVDGATGSVDTTYVQPVGDFLLCFNCSLIQFSVMHARLFRYGSVAPGVMFWLHRRSSQDAEDQAQLLSE